MYAIHSPYPSRCDLLITDQVFSESERSSGNGGPKCTHYILPPVNTGGTPTIASVDVEHSVITDVLPGFVNGDETVRVIILSGYVCEYLCLRCARRSCH
jgi:hypothetical protein